MEVNLLPGDVSVFSRPRAAARDGARRAQDGGMGERHAGHREDAPGAVHLPVDRSGVELRRGVAYITYRCLYIYIYIFIYTYNICFI